MKKPDDGGIGISNAIVQSRIMCVRDMPVIVDADVAEIYGVETKRVNEAVRNNPDKFPGDYMFVLTSDESRVLRSKISSLERTGKGRHSRYNYKAFTEKGLYMLATILKSRQATAATFAIKSSMRFDAPKGIIAKTEVQMISPCFRYGKGVLLMPFFQGGWIPALKEAIFDIPAGRLSAGWFTRIG